MADIKWIKITTSMFDDEKIDFIESLPEADTVLICWIKLLTLAGKANTGGHIMLTEAIPYTPDMLAHKFKRPLNTVKMALETFVRLGMISMEDGSPIYINNWEKHQNIDAMTKIKEQTRQRVARHREKQKLLPDGNGACNVTVTDDVTGSNATDIDKELDKDKDIKPNNNRHKRIYDDDSLYMKMAVYLRDRILAWKENARIPDDLNTWADEFRKLSELDKRSKEDIHRVITFATSNPFWQPNILSAKKLREKFDTLDAQESKSGGINHENGRAGNRRSGDAKYREAAGNISL
ncbi:putative phage replisome organizer [Aneurinibacillus soli]|uniref:Uncharacterized protein n=1 Tax=Aneurinibacillus soli TaxID=1500254 RepID=A0A0U5AYX9_9BACL|nr:phage replisome organizer N-terminal domain-containing protein [Aneurinibacillus soli]PYE62960.1 putative phage replisome organizer [Aneurinibacillus soli]BAU28981.1 hypothetical protein CB4_03159 [Aneurinibacillus soli]